MLALTLTLVHLAAAATGTVHALIYKRDPRAATGWAALCILVPFFGPLAYSLLGINRVRARAQTLRRSRFKVGYERGGPPPEPPQAETGLRGVGARLSSYTLHADNQVGVLHNGDEAYPEMLRAIDAARRRVFLATYIFGGGDIGAAFTDALVRARDRGARVAVLLDGIGDLYTRPRAADVLAARGLEVARFLPPRLLPPALHLNLRNHRKILAVDGRTAFVGGMNISDANTTGRGPRSITDLHFRLDGPVAGDVERMGHEDWHFATGRRLDGAPPNETTDHVAGADDVECRLISDGPDEALDRLALLIQAAVGSAKAQVDIMTPYFVPNRELIVTLQTAALRGVRVRIVLPGKNNLFYVHWANRNMLAELLLWGVEIYYQPPPFCHSKLLLVDTDYALIGSANLDPRSLRLNFELGVEVWSAAFCATLRAHVDRSIAEARRVPFAELDGRSVPVRLRDSAAALLSPYL